MVIGVGDTVFKTAYFQILIASREAFGGPTNPCGGLIEFVLLLERYDQRLMRLWTEPW